MQQEARSRSAQRQRQRARRVRVPQLVGWFLVTSVVLGVVASGLTIPVAAALGGGVHTSSNLLNQTTTETLDTSLEQTSVLEAANGSHIASFYIENRTEVPMSKISPWMQKAQVAIEDSRFYTHGAVDPKGVLRAIVNNSRGGDKQGASTITQQLVKVSELEQASTSGNKAQAQAAIADTFQRKIQDIRLAAELEQTETKQQILERYLNIVFFGDHHACARILSIPACGAIGNAICLSVGGVVVTSIQV